jgi:hypothetical protein
MQYRTDYRRYWQRFLRGNIMAKSLNVVESVNVRLQDRFEAYSNGLITDAEYLAYCRLIIQDGIEEYHNGIVYQIECMDAQLKLLNWPE